MRVGRCDRCRRDGRPINWVWIHAGIWREWCADCFDAAGPVYKPTAGRAGPKEDGTGASWDNALRASEEDR